MRPALPLEPAGHFEHALARTLNGADHALVGAPPADPAAQRQQCADRTDRCAQRHQPTDRLRPVSGRRQHHGMEGQQHVHQRQDLMHVAPDVIWEALPEGDHQHGAEQPHRPFAEVLGGTAKHLEEGFHAGPLHRLAE
ncbi:hypothetical protein D3C80_1360150 [compost metagenome]